MKQILTFICLFLAQTLWAQNSFIESQKSILISRENLKFGYLPVHDMGKPNEKQPFSTVDEIESFLSRITKENESSLPPGISAWISQNLTSYSNDAALIFVRHNLNLEKLYSTAYEKIEKDFTELCNENGKIVKSITFYSAEYEIKKSILKIASDSINSLKKIIEEGKSIKKPINKFEDIIKKQEAASAVAISQLNQLRQIIDSYSKQNEINSGKLTELQSRFNESRAFIEEDTSSFLTSVLSKENYTWSDYLLNKRNIMLVFIGGTKSFKNYQLQITNNKKKISQDFADLLLLLKTVGIDYTPEFKDSGDEDCSPKYPEEPVIPLTYVLIKRSKIDPPSTIEFISSKKEKKILTEVHEKSYAGIKVGISLTDIDKKNFSLNQKNELTVKTDSINPSTIKLNMMALLELYPFGRDYDRLKPVWEKNNIPFYERIGIVGGLKVSKDPLETLFLGGSFAISKEMNFTMGMAFNKVAKDVDSLKVGLNTTLDYLQRNAGKEYKPYLYLGLSLSPGQVLKLFGGKK